MKAGIIVYAAVAAMCAVAGEREAREAELRAKLPDVFAKAAAHYKALDAAATPLMRDEAGKLRYPHGYRRDKGELKMHSVNGWTADHFPARCGICTRRRATISSRSAPSHGPNTWRPTLRSPPTTTSAS